MQEIAALVVSFGHLQGEIIIRDRRWGVRRLSILVAACCAILFGIHFFGTNGEFGRSRSTCTSEPLAEDTSLSGLNFSVVEVNCDTFGKDSAVNVVVSRIGSPGRTVLFKYGRGDGNSIPVIRTDGRTNIRIAIPSINDSIYRCDSWQGLPIIYDIGETAYPTPGKSPGRACVES